MRAEIDLFLTIFHSHALIFQIPTAPAYYKAKEYNPETAINPLVKPVGASKYMLTFVISPNKN